MGNFSIMCRVAAKLLFSASFVHRLALNSFIGIVASFKTLKKSKNGVTTLRHQMEGAAGWKGRLELSGIQEVMSGTFPLEPELIAAAENALPNIGDELVRAKNYLKTQSAASGDTLYDHLVDTVNYLLTHTPADAADTFEQLSWRVKLEKLQANYPGGLRDTYLPPRQLPIVKRIRDMIEVVRSTVPDTEAHDEEEPELELEEFEKARVPDLLHDNYYFKQAGCGIPDNECYNVYMALKMLTIKEPVSSVRFFGKVLGLKANYYVAETELTIEELDKRIREFEIRDMPGEGEEGDEERDREASAELAGPTADEGEELGEGEGIEAPKERTPPPLPPIPLSTWTPTPPVPQERPGQGCNKKYYWVCNKPGEPWVCLPDVTPHQIFVTRNTVRCMTGDLDAEVSTYPPFDGTERNYLRAQLSRIAAATSISPQGYYTLGSGEEEEDIDIEEEGGGGFEINLNPLYAGHTLKDLVDPELSYWVHHARHILPQGRTVWWNPNPPSGEEEEDDEDIPVAIPERGPPFMSNLSEDRGLDGRKLWTPRTSASISPDTAMAVLRSNVWPGAVAVSTTGKKCECLYVGWGLKYEVNNHSPLPLPAVWSEYPVGPDIMEMSDPTFAEEEAYRIAHLPPPPPVVIEEGEGEGVEEEEDEDE